MRPKLLCLSCATAYRPQVIRQVVSQLWLDLSWATLKGREIVFS